MSDDYRNQLLDFARAAWQQLAQALVSNLLAYELAPIRMAQVQQEATARFSAPAANSAPPLHWPFAFPEVFVLPPAGQRGFDATFSSKLAVLLRPA